MSADQDGNSSDASTKVAFNTESWDVTGVYDHSSNYRFTPGVAGKYLITSNIHFRGSSQDYASKVIRVYKNGSFETENSTELDADRLSQNKTNNANITVILELDDNDYIEIYGRSRGDTYGMKAEGSYFSAFKLIGV
mgnify:FL=1